LPWLRAPELSNEQTTSCVFLYLSFQWISFLFLYLHKHVWQIMSNLHFSTRDLGSSLEVQNCHSNIVVQFDMRNTSKSFWVLFDYFGLFLPMRTFFIYKKKYKKNINTSVYFQCVGTKLFEHHWSEEWITYISYFLCPPLLIFWKKKYTW
jgi:hypothetical protein